MKKNILLFNLLIFNLLISMNSGKAMNYRNVKAISSRGEKVSSDKHSRKVLLEILRKLRTNDPSLTKVDLSGFGIASNDITGMGGIIRMGRWHGVSVSRFRSLFQLIDALRNNKHLEKLDLSSNEINFAGAVQLLNVLKKIPTFKKLNLKHNGISDENAEKLKNYRGDRDDIKIKI